MVPRSFLLQKDQRPQDHSSVHRPQILLLASLIPATHFLHGSPRTAFFKHFSLLFQGDFLPRGELTMAVAVGVFHRHTLRVVGCNGGYYHKEQVGKKSGDNKLAFSHHDSHRRFRTNQLRAVLVLRDGLPLASKFLSQTSNSFEWLEPLPFEPVPFI
jgi:hypothetical protein